MSLENVAAVPKQKKQKKTKTKEIVAGEGERKGVDQTAEGKGLEGAEVEKKIKKDVSIEKEVSVKEVPVEKKEGKEEEKETSLEKGSKEKAKKSKRIFTVLSVTLQNGELAEFKGGKFCGSVPSSSARKSANQICKELYGDEDCQITLTVKEVTKGGSNKEYAYIATRKKNEKAVPFTGKDGTVNIAFKYSMNMKALKKNVVTGKTETETVLDEPSVL